MNVLLLGPGRTAIEFQDYAQFNNYDVKIGTRHHLHDPSWLPIDYIATAGMAQTDFVVEQFPEWHNQIVSSQKECLKHNIPNVLPTGNMYHYVECVQVKWAVQLGATHITTIGFDCLWGSVRELECPVWRLKYPVQTHNVEPRYVRERAYKTSSGVLTAKRMNSHIEWQHLAPKHKELYNSEPQRIRRAV